MTQYNLTSVERAAATALANVLGSTYADRLVRGDDRGSRVPSPSATFKFISDIQLAATAADAARDRAGTAPGTFVRELRATRQAVMSVNVYGPTAYGDLRAALLKLSDPVNVEATRAAGLVIQSWGTVQRLPEDNSTERTDRAQVDLVIQYVESVDVDVDAVASVSGTGTDDLTGLTITTTL
jgi:hypothetical protein